MNELPSDINPGILRTVQWLRERGFETCDSGDGETHMAACDRPYPYVSMKVAPGNLIHRTMFLQKLLGLKGITLKSQGEAFIPLDAGGALLPCVQATFDPGDDTAIIDLMGVKDSDLFPSDSP